MKAPTKIDPRLIIGSSETLSIIKRFAAESSSIANFCKFESMGFSDRRCEIIPRQ